jgi:hypothetical protein
VRTSTRSETTVLLIQSSDGASRSVNLTLIKNHVIGYGQALVATSLCGNNASRLFFSPRIACKQSIDLCPFIAIDDENAIDEICEWRACEQWYNDYLVFAASQVSLTPRLGTNSRMEEFLQSKTFTIVGKNRFAHGGPVKVASRIDYVFAKSRLDLIKCRLTGCDHLAGDDVGIYDRHAEFGEHIGNKGFAAGNATGQANSKWGLSGRLSHSEHYV